MKFCPQCRSHLTPKIIDDVERMLCSDGCGFVNWNNPTPVVAALVKVGDEFILARNRSWPEGLFSLISGFLEAGEAPESAVARETTEELGLLVESTMFVGHYPFARMNQIIIAYAVEASGDAVPNEEIAELKKLTIDELKDYDFGVLKLGAIVVRDWLRLRA